jgi:hypothetical protein
MQPNGFKIKSLMSYLSALKSIHSANGLAWPERDDPEVNFTITRLLATPGLPSQESEQDHPVSLNELKLFCDSLRIDYLPDIVAGAAATSLFFGIGRTTELFHAAWHPPMNRTSVRTRIHPNNDGQSFSIILDFPNSLRLDTQHIAPLVTSGATSAAFWIETLLARSPYQNLWQIDAVGTVPPSSWLLDRIRPFISATSTQPLGTSSFRAGGATYMAASGFRRWESQKAFDRYLRDHPYILQLTLANLRP